MTHGTDAGYWRHRRRNEDACAPCKAAHSAYVMEKRRGPYASTYDNPYTREADEALEKDPPHIEWVFCQQKRVMVMKSMNDPHTKNPRGRAA